MTTWTPKVNFTETSVWAHYTILNIFSDHNIMLYIVYKMLFIYM